MFIFIAMEISPRAFLLFLALLRLDVAHAASSFDELSFQAATKSIRKLHRKNDNPLTIHPMPPNPEPYSVNYADGTKSPLIRIQMHGDESQGAEIYEETLDGFTVVPPAKKGAKYEYLDVNEKTGDLVRTGLIVGI